MGWFSGWSQRQALTVSNFLAGCQVILDLSTINWDVIASDGADIRVTDSDGITLLPIWLEEFDYGAKTGKLWIKLPDANTGDLYLYTGNSSASSVSDEDAVFEFFDDFEDNSIDTSKWTIVGSPTETGGEMTTDYKTTAPGDIAEGVKSIAISYPTVTIEWEMAGTGQYKGVCYSETGGKVGWGLGTKENGISIYLQKSGDNIVHDGWDGARSAGDITTSDTNYHTYKMSWDGSNARYSVDEGSEVVQVFSFSPSNWNVGIGNDGTTADVTQNVKYVRVRKYASPEPSLTAGEVERYGGGYKADAVLHSEAGWLEGWVQRQALSISNFFPECQVLLDLSTINWDFITSDGSDIRVTDNDGVTLLPIWLEEFDYGSQTGKLWIKLPATYYLYLYTGNPEATSVSDGDTVFEFFDDFETWKGWTQYGSGQVSQDSTRKYDGAYSAHKTTANDPSGAYKSIGTTLGRSIILEFRVNRNSAYIGGNWDRLGILNIGNDGYGWIYNHYDNKLGIDKRTDYSGTDYSQVAVTDEMDAWVKGIIKITSDTIYAEIYLSDGTLEGSTSLTDTAYTDFNRVYIFGGYDYWVDQMFIRQYISPEPYLTAGSVAKGNYIADALLLARGISQTYALDSILCRAKLYDIDSVLWQQKTFSYSLDGRLELGWLEGWRQRQILSISNFSPECQVLLDLSTIDWSSIASDGSDIRITDDTGVVLPIWLEEFDYGNQTGRLWIKLPPYQCDLLYLYTGNPNATSVSDGTATFEYFDGFEAGERSGTWICNAGSFKIVSTNAYTGGKSGRWYGDLANLARGIFYDFGPRSENFILEYARYQGGSNEREVSGTVETTTPQGTATEWGQSALCNNGISLRYRDSSGVIHMILDPYNHNVYYRFKEVHYPSLYRYDLQIEHGTSVDYSGDGLEYCKLATPRYFKVIDGSSAVDTKDVYIDNVRIRK